jgi:hypothetical protein
MSANRNCEACQKPFAPKKGNQKFCNPKCARKVRFDRFLRRKVEAEVERVLHKDRPPVIRPLRLARSFS